MFLALLRGLPDGSVERKFSYLLQEFMEHARAKWNRIRKNEGNPMNFVMFSSKEELYEQYWYDPTSLSMAVIFNTSDLISEPFFE